MKNFTKLLGITLLIAVMVFTTLAGCGGGGSGGGGTPAPAEPTSTKYESMDADGNTYVLEITNSSARAVYTPKNGDKYVLTIYKADNTIVKSEGTVNVSNTGDTTNFKLTPTTGEPFNVTIKKMGDDKTPLMTGITGTITLTDGTQVQQPNVNPVKVFEEFGLGFAPWPYPMQSMTGYMVLSDFTDKRPKTGDKLTFNVSGRTDKRMKHLYLQVNDWLNENSFNDPDHEYRWLGASDQIDVSAGKFVCNFEVKILQDPQSATSINELTISNVLWGMEGDDRTYDPEDRLPDDTPAYSYTDIIKDFKISLIKVER